ncbi:MAG: hypothetical protein KDC73_12800 [Ignavibacteriae bacterium]|nr:hypothetical protein [Ignavibacteriota bacterium]MCB9242858.1 hypothetical protein [Ignavibacteriales bacterium]
MTKTTIISLFSFLLLLSNNSFSQDIGTIDLSNLKQEVVTNHDFPRGRFLDKPILEMSYGISDISLNGLNEKINNAGMLELKLGYSTQSNSRYGKSVLKYRNGYSFLSLASTDLNSNLNTNELNSQTWRFGLGYKEGYGVELGKSAIMPYTSGAFVWSRFDMKDNVTLSQNDADLLSNFNETFRFGTLTESGINLQIVPLITLQAKYERAIVFPRHLFAVQMGSMLVETVGSFFLGEFIDNVMHNSPILGTIVNFALRSGYSYGIYELRRSEMNWPFGGEAPLSFDTYKVGMTFTF